MKINDILKASQKEEGVLESRAKKILIRGPMSLVELANRLGCAPKTAEAAVERLREKKYNVNLSDDSISIERSIPQGNKIAVDSKGFLTGKWHRFGVVGDTHLYSKYARLDVLRCLYKIFREEGISNIYHGGNAIDGECRFNRHDLVGPAGMGHQLEYFASEYPQAEGVKTFFITGDDHEGWYNQREGVNVGGLLEDAAKHVGREDLKYIGHIEADIEFKAKSGSAWMRVMHPGGGSTYALSYTTQKIVESFQGGEKPHILIAAHYHKYDSGYPREVHTLQPGCQQDQTPFMRKLKIQAFIGGCIVEFMQADTGEITRFRHEFIPFFDKHFYLRGEKYRRW